MHAPRTRLWHGTRAGVATALALALAACGGSGAGGVEVVPPPASIAMTSGDGQSGPAGVALAAPFVVTVTDVTGAPAAGIGVTFVVVAGGGTLSGSQPVLTGANGQASATLTLGTTFGTNVVDVSTGLGLSGEPVTFTATANVGIPTQLLFVAQPKDAQVSATLTPAVSVAVADALGNPVTTATNAITLAIGNNPGGATLGGTLTRNAGAGTGIATFADLSLDAIGTGYTLVASAAGLTSATSTPFDITTTPPQPPTASVSDFNGDGFDDLLIGSAFDDQAGTDAGAAYLFFGSATGIASTSAANADVTFLASAAGDWFGKAVALADVDGDTLADVLIGAPRNDLAFSDAGAVYVFLGQATSPATIQAKAADTIYTGQFIDSRFGSSVASAGDFDGDGITDVLVGSPGTGGVGTGKLGTPGDAYVFADPPGSMVVPAGSATTHFAAGSVGGFGSHVASAGDFNGDGIADVVVAEGNAGVVHLFFGSATPPSFRDTDDVAFVGGGPFPFLFGRDFASPGDLDGDGFSDLLIGRTGSTSDFGHAYLYRGQPNPPTSFQMADADTVFTGEAVGDRFGQGVASAGDVNGDGIGDLLIGAQMSDAGGTDIGRAYLFLGSATMPATVDAVNAATILSGATAGDYLGGGLAGLSDVDGDGFDDLAIGAPGYDDGPNADAGAVHVFHGAATPPASRSATTADATVTGAAGESLGIAIAR